MKHDDERMWISEVSARAVAAALDVGRAAMPEASEKRLVLMILGNAAAYAGRLRIEHDDVLNLTSGMFKQGTALPPLDDPRRQ